METNVNLDIFAGPVTAELAAKHIAAVAAHHGKNEKLAWKRKVKKMMGLIEQVGFVEQEILELSLKKQPTLDEISVLRAEMIKECIHPKDHLVHLGTCLLCKFCENKISIPRILKSERSEEENVSE